MADIELYETVSYLKEREKQNRRNLRSLVRILQDEGIIQAGEVKFKDDKPGKGKKKMHK